VPKGVIPSAGRHSFLLRRELFGMMGRHRFVEIRTSPRERAPYVWPIATVPHPTRIDVTPTTVELYEPLYGGEHGPRSYNKIATAHHKGGNITKVVVHDRERRRRGRE